MSRQSTFSNTIHFRDFVNNVTDDLSRENAPNYVEIIADVNIFNEDGFLVLALMSSPPACPERSTSQGNVCTGDGKRGCRYRS